jgi:hypothetical protein
MFSTKGQEVKQGGGVQKSLQPGVVYAHIFSASVKESKNTGKKSLEFILEGPALENFEGWSIEKGNDSGPKFKGQSARVSASMWIDSANETSPSKNEIMNKLSIIAVELGLKDELDQINASSIEDWVAQVTKLVAGKNLYFFLKGQEEEYNGKTIVKLSLPKFKYASAYEDKLDVFDRNNQYHFKALQNKPVAGFEPVNDDFNM